MPLVVKLEQGRAEGVQILQVDVVDLWLLGGVTAVLADVHLKNGDEKKSSDVLIY